MADDVKVELTPSAELVKSAKAEVSITDPKGRVIVLRKPGPLAQFRLVENVGANAATNPVYMQMVLPLIYVSTIDGSPASTQSKREIEGLIQRLDDDGVEAVMKAVHESWGAPDPEADKASLKN